MEKRQEYFLMNRDEKVMLFTSEKNEYGEVLLEEQEVFGISLPPGFEDIQSFIAHRQAPKHRKHILNLLRRAGCEDLEGFLRVSKALSLNDTFWVKPAKSRLCWKEVSLYQNDFNEVIAQIAFDGGDYETDFSSTSPEYGTDGFYAKCWIRRKEPQNGPDSSQSAPGQSASCNIYLLKTGSDTCGIEPFSDFYASQLAEVICPEAVHYEIGEWHGKIVSFCPLFTSEAKGYVPAIKMLDGRKHNKISYLMEYFSEIGLEDAFRRMIVLDALIINEDRHAGNYGFTVDNRTQEILGMAPMFDHNRSLLYGCRSPEEVPEYLKQQLPRIGTDFNTAAHSLLTPQLRQELLNLKGFHFRRDGDFDLPEERMLMLEQVVNRQICNILNGTSLYHYRA